MMTYVHPVIRNRFSVAQALLRCYSLQGEKKKKKRNQRKYEIYGNIKYSNEADRIAAALKDKAAQDTSLHLLPLDVATTTFTVLYE